MSRAASVVRLTATGGPEVLKTAQTKIEKPGAGQVWLEQEAIGVNYLDVMQRNGAVPLQLPSGLGLEGAGRVAAVGSGVPNVNLGDRVAYAIGPIGSYASGRLYPADRLVHLPEKLTLRDAASVLFKGITAQYLLKTIGTIDDALGQTPWRIRDRRRRARGRGRQGEGIGMRCHHRLGKGRPSQTGGRNN